MSKEVEFLTKPEVIKRYRISESTWQRMVESGRAPKPIHFGRAVRWKRLDLELWEAGIKQ